MRKERLSQILDILLLPYADTDFCVSDQDVIKNLRNSFAKLRDRQDMEDKGRNIEHDYYKNEKYLNDFLRSRKEWQIENLDDLRMLINLFYPEEWIANKFDECKMNNRISSYNIERYYLFNIFRIAKSLLTFRDGEMAIRAWINEERNGESDIFEYSNIFDKVEIWNILCRKIVPDIFIVAFYLEAELKEPRYLYGQTGSIMLADKSLERILQKGIAETHLHLNAGLQFEILWNNATTLLCWENCVHLEKKYQERMKKDMVVGLHVVVFRLVVASYLEELKEEEIETACFCSYVKEPITKSLLDSLYSGCDPKYNENWYNYIERIEESYEVTNMDLHPDDLLMETVYNKYKHYGTCSEMILMLKCIHYLKENKNDLYLSHLFFQYIRIKNNFYKKIVKSNTIRGLDDFNDYYKEMRKSVNKYIPSLNKQYELVFKSISNNSYLRKLEIRITLPDIKEVAINEETIGKKDFKIKILESVQCVLTEYQKYILMTRKNSVTRYTPPTLGIIFHFLKRNFVDNRIPDMCWYVGDKDRIEDSKHILKWRKDMVICAKAIEELRSEIPLLSEYIVGIDVASIENNAEPWIFAPIYSEIRNRKITKPLLYDKSEAIKINNIGFTYHVGEEFRHVLSGLRHVYEVVRFFHYKAGDRIGHAIVLGIDVEKWVRENEVVVMPIIEYLEDLLWLWGGIVHGGNVFSVSIDVIEGRILELARKIYGEILGITPNMLYDAYMKKFELDNDRVFTKMCKYQSDVEDPENEHFCRYYDKSSCYGMTWTKEKLLCTYFCPIYYQKMQQPTLVHVNKEMCQVLKEVQDQVVQLIEQKGIYVEVNPTSNLAIGEADSLQDSHLFRLNSRNIKGAESSHEVLVTVNSDDPMIFSTNSENELAYVYHAMNYKGYGKESVLEWVDKIRQYGIDSSFIKKEKSVSEQLKEIKYLLEEIEMFQKRQN